MHKSRVVLGCMALVLILALLIPLVGCGGGETTATPTGTTTGATTTPTKTSTSTSGKTLGDICGWGKNIGDVKMDYDVVIAQPGQPQATALTGKYYYKNAWLSDNMKLRSETTVEGNLTIYLVDYSTQTAYMWLKDQNIAYRIDMSQAPSKPGENADQVPTYVGPDTVDSKLCDVYQWTSGEGTTWPPLGTPMKIWVWKQKPFPIRMEATLSSGTVIMEYKNIVFGTLSNDLFQLPAGVQVTQ